MPSGGAGSSSGLGGSGLSIYFRRECSPEMSPHGTRELTVDLFPFRSPLHRRSYRASIQSANGNFLSADQGQDGAHKLSV
jgi:hypothetical protein